jgi:hypothetical protein
MSPDLQDSPADENALASIENLVGQVTEIPALEAELRSELERFRRECFRRLLTARTSEIRSACEEWDLETAWSLLDRLEQSGANGGELLQLLDLANEADELHAKASVAVERWPSGSFLHWADLRVALESIDEAGRFLEDSRTPVKWREEIRRRREALVAGGLEFLRGEASAAATIGDLM